MAYKPKPPKPIGPERLNLAMDLTGHSAADLAKATGLSAAYVSQLRSGKRTAERERMDRENLARAMKVPVDWIEAGDPVETKEPAPVLRSGPQRGRAVRPYPPKALVAAVGIGTRALARQLDVDPSMLTPSRPLTRAQAEKYAKQAGVSPAEVWKNWRAK